jgi:succinate-acetate transporter protein
MFLKLRIIFTVLAAVCLTLVLPIGAFGGLIGAIAAAAAAGVFFLLMLIFKQEQEKRENPPSEEPDFLHPQKKGEAEDGRNNKEN